MQLLNIIVLLSLVAVSANLKPAGIAASVDIDVVKKFKDFAMPRFVEEMNHLQIPKIEFDGGFIDNVKFGFGINDLNSIDINFNGAKNGVQVKAKDIHGSFTGKFYYKVLFLSASGNFKVVVHQGGATLDMTMPMSSTLVNGRMLPAIGI